MKKSLVLLTILFLFSVFLQTAGAAVIHVPADYPTIHDGITAAQDGDEVVVSPGTYYEFNIFFQKKKVTVRSVDPEDPIIVGTTIVDGSAGGHAVFNLYMGEGPESVLSGFTIRGGQTVDRFYFGGGISCFGSSPTIQNNIFENNASMHGGAIFCYESEAVIINNKIRNNYASIRGGGICLESSSCTVSGNSISGNQSNLRGGGIYTYTLEEFDPSSIDGNIISLNRSNYGGGIYCMNASVTNNYVMDNVAESTDPGRLGIGGGIYGKSSLINGNTVYHNTTDYIGGGINIGETWIEGKSTVVSDNIISQNFAGFSSGGLNVDFYTNALVQNNDILSNQARRGAGLFTYNGRIVNNVIAGNEGYSDDPEHTTQGGGVYIGDISVFHTDPPQLINNTLDRNSAHEGGNIYIHSSNPVIKNNIISHAESGGGIVKYEYGDRDYQPVISYCNLYQNQGGDYVGLTDLTGSRGNISWNPLYADPEYNDYHLLSAGGRWSGTEWVVDYTTSHCVDRGDPESDFSQEPQSNGERVNMGAYGNTWEASKANPYSLNIFIYEVVGHAYPLLEAAYPDSLNASLAEGSEQLMKMLENETVHAVLIDISMPDDEGLNTARVIKESKFELKNQDPVIIGYSKEDIKGGKDLCLAFGMDDYVPVPDAKKLMKAIETAIKNQEARDLSGQPEELQRIP